MGLHCRNEANGDVCRGKGTYCLFLHACDSADFSDSVDRVLAVINNLDAIKHEIDIDQLGNQLRYQIGAPDALHVLDNRYNHDNLYNPGSSPVGSDMSLSSNDMASYL